MGDIEFVEMSDSQKDLVRRYVGDMVGLKAIGKEIHRDPRSFKHELTGLGIKIPFPGSVWKKMQDHYSSKFDKSISPFLEEIIQGSLLGDGNIRLQSKVDPHLDNPSMKEYGELLSDIEAIRQNLNGGSGLTSGDINRWNQGIEMIRNTNTASFRMHKSITEINWVKNLANILGSEIDVGHKFINKVHREQDIKWTCGFDTLSSVQIQDIWKSWYTQDGKVVEKFIPRDRLTALSPDSVLQWYTGDGYYSGKGIGLSTCGFTKDDQLYLVGLLAKIGVESHLIKPNNGHEIAISHKKENRENFFNYLSRAKNIALAKRELPQKFDGSFRKNDLITNLKKSNPEFFDKTSNVKWDDY